MSAPSGSRFGDVRRFETVDSTNRYLLDEARAGAPEGVVAVADYQTAGRGRRGRRWSAPPGSNLLLSVLLRPRLPPALRHLAVGVVALAARDAVASVVGVELGLKWPNDLVTGDGRKVAGVLAETDVDAGRQEGVEDSDPAVVVGVGLNCNWPDHATAADTGDEPDAGLARAASLRQLTGSTVDRDELLDAFLEQLGPRVDALADASGRERLQSELRALCATLGTPVRVELADRVLEGTATDLTDEGHLLVVTAHGPETVVAGDVVHLHGGGAGSVGGVAPGSARRAEDDGRGDRPDGRSERQG